jgi:hypothetical protein
MAGLDPAIHVFVVDVQAWMPATSAGMTNEKRLVSVALGLGRFW